MENEKTKKIIMVLGAIIIFVIVGALIYAVRKQNQENKNNNLNIQMQADDEIIRGTDEIVDPVDEPEIDEENNNPENIEGTDEIINPVDEPQLDEENNNPENLKGTDEIIDPEE